MAKKKKSNSVNAARELESSVSPILEINYADPLFSVAAHPTKPILLSGLATGHLYCNTYDGEKLEEAHSARREEISLLEKEAFKRGKISQVNKSVSQTKKKWWTVIEDNTDIPDGRNIVTNWKTKRHKGSCRSVLFDPLENSVGESIYSVGSDHVIKKANTETGKVTGKVILSDHYPNSKDAVTKLAHSSTHPFLLSGTENGHVLVFDSNNLKANELKFKVSQAHDDAINHILPMPAVSAYHYLTLGSTTLSHIDIRKGIITQSDDQEDELLSMCYATDQINENKNDTVLVSHGEGIITIWKNSKNNFRDQLSRIKVNKSASIDAIIPTMNYDDGDQADSVWCGDSEGLLHRVNYKRGKVVETRVHSAAVGKYGASDEVGILDIDYDYRLISAGMDSLKIWSGQTVEDDSDSDDSDDSDSDSDDSDSDLNGANDSDDFSGLSDSNGSDNDGSDKDNSDKDDSDKNGSDNDDSDNDDSDNDDSDNDNSDDTPAGLKGIVRRKRIMPMLNKPAPKKKVVDINKLTKTQSKPEPKPEPEVEENPKKKQKLKEKKMTTKQLRNLQKHEHGIKKFEDL